MSQAAVDQSEAEYKAAQAQLAAVKASRAGDRGTTFNTITAPYAGVVGATLAELGDMAQPGRPLLTVFDPRDLRVTATLPQTALSRLKLSEPVRVEIASLGKSLTATRVTVIPVADARTHTTRIRLDLPAAEGVLPGQFARARFVTGAVRVLAVPATALLRRGEVTAVYVVDGQGRAQLRQVRAGEEVGEGFVEILSGLSAGERIALNPVQAGMSPAMAATKSIAAAFAGGAYEEETSHGTYRHSRCRPGRHADGLRDEGATAAGRQGHRGRQRPELPFRPVQSLGRRQLAQARATSNSPRRRTSGRRASRSIRPARNACIPTGTRSSSATARRSTTTT